MKFSHLLAQRDALLRQAHLANLAFAYDRLEDFSRRIVRAKLRGEVNLRHIAPDDGRYFATLTATAGRQSVIEEHFTEGDIMDFADVVSFMTCSETLDLTFRLEDLPRQLLASIRHELERARITIDAPSRRITTPDNNNPTKYSPTGEEA